VLDLLSSFIAELRTVGIPVSMSETVDAARALESIDIADQPLFRAALRATLVKSGDHQSAFDTAYDVFFANRRDEDSGAAFIVSRSPSSRRLAKKTS